MRSPRGMPEGLPLRRVLAALLAVGVLSASALVPGSLQGEESVEARIHQDPDLSEFYMQLEKDSFANTTLQLRTATIFAPTNMAFQKFPSKNKHENLVLYHMTNTPVKLENMQLPILYSQVEGNPPLWVTPRKGLHGQEDVYINNAKVDRKHSDYSGKNAKGLMQVLHKIDAVLEPVRVRPGAASDVPLYNPNAQQLISQSISFDLENYTIMSFADAIQRNKESELFGKDGRHTFFIPVDSEFKHFEKVDRKVIEGHVIPGHVLFTAPTPNEKDYATVAFGDTMQVTITFNTDHKKGKTIVKSNTHVGDDQHPTGVVMAEVVKANIPVLNGVVHLIDRPLMIIDATVQEFIEDREDGPLYEFQRVLTTKVDTEFIRDLGKMSDVTVFAPSNEAWRNPAALAAINNRTMLHEVIRLHIVPARLPLEHIKNQTHHHQVRHHSQHGSRHQPHKLYQVGAMAARKSLYFNVVVSGSNHTLTVEGGGVNATVIQPDIAATNGIIHIIDRVLGVASHTVKEKLATDPTLTKTFMLGQDSFNDQLSSNATRYTYFVPRDRAWHNAELHHPSAYKKLFMKEYRYHAQQILQRHLVVANHAYTMADIKRMTLLEPVVLHTVRDQLKLQLKEKANGYYLQWQNEEIPVHRADVECTNGIIHVLDGVFLKESDIRVTGAAGALLPALLPAVLPLLAARWLL